MRNFNRGFKSDNASFSSRNDRRGDRDQNRYGSDNYKRPADKGFNRSFNDRNNKPRRDYDINNGQTSRSSFNQERRESRGGNRSFPDRSFRNQNAVRSFRNQTPPRSRDRSNHTDRIYRGDRNRRPSPSPPPPPSFNRSRNDFQTSSARPRPARGGISSRRGGANGSRILRRNDLRSSLIMKRSVPSNRSKEYIKKIKQARMKLTEGGSNSKAEDEPKTPPKEDKTEDKQEEDEDFLDVANDVNFEEDDDYNTAKNSSAAKSEDNSKDKKDEKVEEKDKTSSENLNASGTSDGKSSRRERSVKSQSKERSTLDLNCLHCATKCSSIQDFRYHLTRRTHLITLKRVSTKLRMTLNRLRKVQRDRQLEIEARLNNVENIPSKYCQICKLYFRQSKIEHRDSDDHKKIRNFLKPYCKICHIQMISPMSMEVHKCSVNHIKMKSKKSEVDEDVDMQELDLGDFKTLDSIGDVDGEEVESAIDEDEEFETPGDGSAGQDYINKVEVNYCSLCREYLLRSSNDEKIIAEHCKSKKHIKWYNQSKKKEIISKQASEALEKSKEDENHASLNENDKKKDEHESEADDNHVDSKNEKNEEESNDDNSKSFPRYYEDADK